MKNFIKYMKYIIKHKYYVFLAGRYIGLSYWRCLSHDLSKFRLSEWIPYQKYFYGYYKSYTEFPTSLKLDWPNWYKSTKEYVKADFDEAWLFHIHRNPHHWQYWVLRNDDGTVKALDMPINIIKEMVADWTGAGIAITHNNNLRSWFNENKHKMIMSENTMVLAEQYVSLLENFKI